VGGRGGGRDFEWLRNVLDNGPRVFSKAVFGRHLQSELITPNINYRLSF